MTKFNGSRFEFIFTNLERNSGSSHGAARNDSSALKESGGSPAFLTLQAVHKAYAASKLFRDLKLRGAIIADDELRLLRDEEVYNKISGVMNLSNQRGNNGVFHLTNVRLVWHAEHSENFNVSIPYLQMKSIAVRESKFGRALVITTTQRSGGYVLGFRVESQEKLEAVHREVEALHRVFTKNPVFGVVFDPQKTTGSRSDAIEVAKRVHEEDDVEIVDSGDAEADLVSKYYADAEGIHGVDRSLVEPVFDETLGLAIEPLPPGTTAAALWSVL
jgi:Bardet-Biedl syndrome 5 protein